MSTFYDPLPPPAPAPRDMRLEYVCRSIALAQGVDPDSTVVPRGTPIPDSPIGFVISAALAAPAWTLYAGHARAAIEAIEHYDAVEAAKAKEAA